MKYADIIFLQDNQAEEALSILNRQGEQKAFEYLQQWDYGESPMKERNEEGFTPWGRLDRLYKKDNYIMSYNTGLDYIGLIEIVTD